MILAPQALDFGTVPAGTTSTPQTVTIRSVNSPILIENITVIGANPGDFATGGTCLSGMWLDYGTSCTITVNFTPGSPGQHTAQLSIRAPEYRKNIEMIHSFPDSTDAINNPNYVQYGLTPGKEYHVDFDLSSQCGSMCANVWSDLWKNMTPVSGQCDYNFGTKFIAPPEPDTSMDLCIFDAEPQLPQFWWSCCMRVVTSSAGNLQVPLSGTGSSGTGSVTSVRADPVSASTVYAGLDGPGVYRSTDSGDTWTGCTNTGLANLNVLSLATNSTGGVYSGTENGIYASTDNCTTWTALNTGLP